MAALVWWKQETDVWIAHRLGDSTVTNLLPGGANNIVNTVLPEQSATQYPLLEFHEAGTIPTVCLSGMEDGAELEYMMQVYHPDPEWDAMKALLLAVGARFFDSQGVPIAEAYNGYVFTVLGRLAEFGGVKTTPGGVLYANGGFRWKFRASLN